MKRNYAKYLLEKTRKDYNLIAEDFSRTRNKPWQEIKFLIDDYIKRKDKVLDLGCGNGRLYELLKRRNIDYIGVDSSKELIKLAKKKYPEAEFRKAEALNLPFFDNYFDKVYTIAVFHQIPSEELRLQFLKETKRVLKKKGKLILTVWKIKRKKEALLLLKYTILRIIGKSKLDFKDVFKPWGEKTERYYHIFSKRELSKLIKKAGFSIKEIGVVKNERGNRQNIYTIAEK